MYRTSGCRAVLLPAGDFQHDPVTCNVVLHAHEEPLAGGVEDSASPLSGQIVKGTDADAAVAEKVLIGAVGQAVPEVIVVWLQILGVGVFVDDPVARGGLVGDIIGHSVRRATNHEELHLGSSGVGCRLGQSAVADADGLAPVLVVGLIAGVVAAELDQAVSRRLLVSGQVLGPVVTGST